MKAVVHAAAFAAAVSAAVLRRDQCCFQITATGGVSGVMGHLSDGQNRINGSYPAATYCLNTGIMLDDTGKTCLVTLDNDATHQFQCDEHPESAPLSATTGWSIANNGSLLFQGNDQFYACPATDTEYNLYTQWLKGQDKCKAVKLNTNSNSTSCGTSGGGQPAPSGSASVYVSTPVGPVGGSATGYVATQSQNTPVAYSSHGTAPYPYPSQSVPGHGTPFQGTAPVYSAASTPIVPGYGLHSAPGHGSIESSVPAYSATTEATTVETVPSYNTETAPVNSAATEATTAETIPAYGPSSKPVVPGYSSASIASSIETAPVHSSASTPVVPAYSSASAPSSIETAPVYSSSTPVVPGYSSSASTPVASTPVESAPVESTPATSAVVTPYVPVGETTPVASSTSKNKHHINSFTPSLLTTIVKETTSCYETSPAESTGVPSTVPVVLSYPAGSTSEAVSTTPVVPSYPAGSSSTAPSAPSSIETSPVHGSKSNSSPASVPTYPVQSETVPSDTTVTLETTYSTTYCPVTETQISSGSTKTTVYSTWSTITSVNKPTTAYATESTTAPVATSGVPVGGNTTVVPSGTKPAGYGIPSASAGTAYSASTSCSESETTGVASSSSTPAGPVSSATLTASVPGYGSPSTGAATTSAASSTQPATSTTATACQTELSGAYQTPHLIEWIAKEYPDTAYGSKLNASINADCDTLFNFDIPDSYEGKTCSVIFLFPEEKDLETSAYTLSGSGNLVFSELSGVATEQTTYNTCPAVNSTLDSIAIQPGNSYVVATGPCAAGTTATYKLSSENGLTLEFFEDWNPSSLGLYVTAC